MVLKPTAGTECPATAKMFSPARRAVQEAASRPVSRPFRARQAVLHPLLFTESSTALTNLREAMYSRIPIWPEPHQSVVQ